MELSLLLIVVTTRENRNHTICVGRAKILNFRTNLEKVISDRSCLRNKKWMGTNSPSNDFLSARFFMKEEEEEEEGEPPYGC